MDLETFRQQVARVAVGPHGSRSLTRPQARDGMGAILDHRIPDVTAAVWLIGMRLKGETLDELLGMLDALDARTRRTTAPVPRVVVWGEPHDGWTRLPHWAPFTCAVLGALGWPSYVVAARGVPPKEGHTHLDVLDALGGHPPANAEDAAGRLERCGWAVLDVATVHPALAALVTLRRQMVKRTALATLEKALRPVEGTESTHWVVGFVHRAYGELLVALGEGAGFASTLAIRGAEGFADVRCGASTTWHTRDHAGALPALDAVVSPPAPDAVAAAGRAALAGVHNAAREQIAATAALVLAHLEGIALEDAMARCRRALDDGAALARLEAGL